MTFDTASFSAKMKAARTWILGHAREWAGGLRAMELGFVARFPVILAGGKGTAKTMTARRFGSVFPDARYLERQVRRSLEFDDLVGRQNFMRYMRENVVEFNTAGGILEADIVFLDEFGLGSDSLQESLFGWLNGDPVVLGNDVHRRRSRAVMATNTLKQISESSDGAVDEANLDRLKVKYRVHPHVRALKNQEALFDSPDKETVLLEACPVPIALAELEEATERVKRMVDGLKYQPNGKDIKSAFLEGFLRKARRAGCRISDRMWMEARRLWAANAILRGRDEILFEDAIKTAHYWAWLTEEELEIVLQLVPEFVPSAIPKAQAEGIAVEALFSALLAQKNLSREEKISAGNKTNMRVAESIMRVQDLMTANPEEMDEMEPHLDRLMDIQREVTRNFTLQTAAKQEDTDEAVAN